MPAMPDGAASGIVKGMYLFRAGEKKAKAPRVQLLGSGTIFREVIAAAALLKSDWGVEADLWSCPSFTELARDCMRVTRENMLHPTAKPKPSHAEACLRETVGPVIAATDYMRAYADQIRACIGRRTSCSERMDSGVRTRARSCGASSRSTATTSASPR
jgi:pyruvate dehydrogenase E1 component